MTKEQAESELMQIYGMLSEEKKQAIDVLMAQADGDHDGCKDCVYQDNPQDAMPCRECKQNYMDKWKAKPSTEPKTGHWIYDRTRDWDGECKYECSECGMGSDVDYAYCMRCGARMECEQNG